MDKELGKIRKKYTSDKAMTGAEAGWSWAGIHENAWQATALQYAGLGISSQQCLDERLACCRCAHAGCCCRLRCLHAAGCSDIARALCGPPGPGLQPTTSASTCGSCCTHGCWAMTWTLG